jgi:IS30 family transposase
LDYLNSQKVIKVKVTNTETNLSEEYTSITETAKMLNSNKSTITKYIKNSLLFNGIYKLEADIPNSNYDSNYINHPNAIKIEVTDLDLNTITTYTSVSAAARSLDIGHNTISNYFKRNQMRPYKGRYIFKKVSIMESGSPRAGV